MYIYETHGMRHTVGWADPSVASQKWIEAMRSHELMSSRPQEWTAGMALRYHDVVTVRSASSCTEAAGEACVALVYSTAAQGAHTSLRIHADTC